MMNDNMVIYTQCWNVKKHNEKSLWKVLVICWIYLVYPKTQAKLKFNMYLEVHCINWFMQYYTYIYIYIYTFIWCKIFKHTNLSMFRNIFIIDRAIYLYFQSDSWIKVYSKFSCPPKMANYFITEVCVGSFV